MLLLLLLIWFLSPVVRSGPGHTPAPEPHLDLDNEFVSDSDEKQFGGPTTQVAINNQLMWTKNRLPASQPAKDMCSRPQYLSKSVESYSSSSRKQADLDRQCETNSLVMRQRRRQRRQHPLLSCFFHIRSRSSHKLFRFLDFKCTCKIIRMKRRPPTPPVAGTLSSDSVRYECVYKKRYVRVCVCVYEREKALEIV